MPRLVNICGGIKSGVTQAVMVLPQRTVEGADRLTTREVGAWGSSSGQPEAETPRLAVSPRRVGDGSYDYAHQPHARRGLALHTLLSVARAPSMSSCRCCEGLARRLHRQTQQHCRTPLPLWSGGLGHREDEEIARLQTCQRSRRHGQDDRLALRRPDLHTMRGGINSGDSCPHGPLGVLEQRGRTWG